MKKLLFGIIFILFSSGSVSAQLVSWNFPAEVKGNETLSYSTTADPSVETSVLSRGPGAAPQKATNSFSSTWPASGSMPGAVKLGAYYQFTVRSKKGYTLSLDHVSMILRIQSNGPTTYILMYSIDGGHFIDIGSPVRVSPTSNDGEQQPPIDLSQTDALQNIPPRTAVTFRLYAWGGRGESDNAFRIGKSSPGRDALAVYGTAVKK